MIEKKMFTKEDHPIGLFLFYIIHQDKQVIPKLSSQELKNTRYNQQTNTMMRIVIVLMSSLQNATFRIIIDTTKRP